MLVHKLYDNFVIYSSLETIMDIKETRYPKHELPPGRYFERVDGYNLNSHKIGLFFSDKSTEKKVDYLWTFNGYVDIEKLPGLILELSEITEIKPWFKSARKVIKENNYYALDKGKVKYSEIWHTFETIGIAK